MLSCIVGGQEREVKSLYDKIMAAEAKEVGTDAVVKSHTWQAKLTHTEMVKICLRGFS